MRRPAFALLVAALASSGCGGGEPPRSVPAPAASSAADAPAGTWQVVESWPREEGHRVGDYSGKYVAWLDEHVEGNPPQWLRIYRGDELVLERVSESPEWFTQDAWLTGDVAVVEDLNDKDRLVRLTAYDLLTGEEVTIPEQPTQPEVHVAGGRVAFVRGTADTRMCHQVLDLGSGGLLATDCADKGAIVGDVSLGPDASGYSTVVGAGSKDRCKTLTVTRAGQPEPVSLQRSCLGWSAAMTADALAWDEMDPSGSSLGMARGFIKPSDGPLVRLGQVSTDSLLACGGRFFWLTEDGGGIRIDSWSAERGVETVRHAELDVFPAGLECTDDRWLHARFDSISGKDERLSLEALDTHA